MLSPFEDPDGQFLVLINQEEQYSLWPICATVPKGWRVVGPTGKAKECLDWIDKNWEDMRPASLRQQQQLLSDVPS
jgi:MbtH protein